MKAFCRVVERGGLARAAEDLGVSPALVSRDLKLLEQSLGCVLLNRTTRSMSLTEHGRLYYVQALRLLADFEALEARVRDGAGRVAGRLRVNAPQAFTVAVLGPALPALMARHPELELSLALDDRVVDMVEGGFDLSIRIRAALPDSGLVATPLGRVRQRLFASPGFLAAHGAPRTPADLEGLPALGYLLADAPSTWALTGPGGEVAVPLRPRLSVESSLVLRDLLAAGEGIGALPDFLSDPFEADGRLVRVLPGHELPERRIYAVAASRLGMDARALAVLDHLRGVLGG